MPAAGVETSDLIDSHSVSFADAQVLLRHNASASWSDPPAESFRRRVKRFLANMAEAASMVSTEQEILTSLTADAAFRVSNYGTGTF